MKEKNAMFETQELFFCDYDHYRLRLKARGFIFCLFIFQDDLV